MKQKIITITLHGAAADRLRKALAEDRPCETQNADWLREALAEDKPKRIDWSAFSHLWKE